MHRYTLGVLLGTTFLLSSITAMADSVQGAWSGPIVWPIERPIVTVHMNLLPNGKVLAWQHHDEHHDDDPNGIIKDSPNPHIWDPVTGDSVSVPVPSMLSGLTRDEIYCSGHSFLPDGRLLVTGGHKKGTTNDRYGSNQTHIFDYRNNSWSAGPDMGAGLAAGRWYPTNVPLGSGNVLVLSGFSDATAGHPNPTEEDFIINPVPQVYDFGANTWFSLSSAEREIPLYAWVYPAKGGKVFYAGPGPDTGYLNLSTQTWTGLYPTVHGLSRNAPGRGTHRGTSVLYDEGKIVNIGGGSDPLTAIPTPSAEVIDLDRRSPVWRAVAPMHFARQHLNATLLPDGKVLVTGGTSATGFSDGSGAVLAAEMWDPATETWSVMAPMTHPRLHHSTAILLPDGRVLAGGGGQPTGLNDTNHMDVEIYSPPYLFKGPRPRIEYAPSSVGYGNTFTVTTPEAASIRNVAWIRLAAETHGFNQNQAVHFSKASGKIRRANSLTLTAPSDRNVCPPGHYMLFLLNEQRVPSVATIVQIL